MAVRREDNPKYQQKCLALAALMVNPRMPNDIYTFNGCPNGWMLAQ